jgi:hypothetical protein
MPKLFEVPRNTEIHVAGDPAWATYTFHHIDGAYSYCTDNKWHVYHFHANTEVEIVEGPVDT